MIISRSSLVAHRACSLLRLAALLVAVSGIASNAAAQLTAENLIGSAVSLSNQSYPEIDNAIQRFRNGDVKGTRKYLEIAKEKYPKLPPTDVTLAKMQMAARHNQAARILLERVVTETPDDPEAYLLLADQAFAAGRTTEAQALFELAAPLVEKYGQNAKRKRNFTIRLLAGRAAVYERRRQWEQAYDLLKQWVEKDPDNAAAHQRLGIALFRLQKVSEAIEEFGKARQIKPDVAHPYVTLGLLFSQQGDMDKAQQAFEKAYAENKADAATAQTYAEWLIQQGKLDQAQTVASALLQQEKGKDSINALLLDGIVAYMKGQTDRAEQSLSQVLRLDPSNAKATNLLALLLIQSDNAADRERALSHAEVNADRFPNNAQANITKAWVLYRLGRAKEAQESLQKGARARQLTADSAFLIAKILMEQNRKEEAKRALEQIVNQKTGIFIFRQEAQQLLDQLNKEGG